MSVTRMAAPQTKTQFYNANGAGRDSYIAGNNGGFCPPKEPCKIEELGKLFLQLPDFWHGKLSDPWTVVMIYYPSLFL